MIWRRINDRQFSEVGYDPYSRALYVKGNMGVGIYRFGNVQESQWAYLLRSHHPGVYIRKEFVNANQGN